MGVADPAQKTEFSRAELLRSHEPLSRMELPGGWTPERARNARDAQMRGNFRQSALLAEAGKTDPQIFGALLNRIAPHRGLPRKTTGQGKRIVSAAESMLVQAVSPAVDADAFEWTVQVGVAVETIRWAVSDDGALLVPRVVPWPMASVWWDRVSNELRTLTTKGVQPIRHGDGRWIVTTLQSGTPWQSGCVKAIADSWTARAAHRRDRSLNSETHGEAKILGTLPEEEQHSDDVAAFVELVKDLRKRRSGGVKPYGSTIEMLESSSQMWRIFQDAITSLDKDIARAYLGQDGSLVNEGGNYIKSALLFGVRNDLVEGDLGARARALNTGLLLPWSMVNFGKDAQLETAWQFPDSDRDARAEAYGRRFDAFNRAIKEAKANGFEVTQDFVDRLAERYDVEAPRLAEEATKQGGAEIYAYDLQYGVATLNEARARKGLAPRDGSDITVPERDAEAADTEESA